MQMMFLPNLAKRGISAVLLDDGRVRLSPQANVSDGIFEVAKANKAGILEEIRALGNVGYTTDELALMAGCTAEDVALLSDVKQIFGGKLDATYKAGSEGGSQNAA